MGSILSSSDRGLEGNDNSVSDSLTDDLDSDASSDLNESANTGYHVDYVADNSFVGETDNGGHFENYDTESLSSTTTEDILRASDAVHREYNRKKNDLCKYIKTAPEVYEVGPTVQIVQNSRNTGRKHASEVTVDITIIGGRINPGCMMNTIVIRLRITDDGLYWDNNPDENHHQILMKVKSHDGLETTHDKPSISLETIDGFSDDNMLINVNARVSYGNRRTIRTENRDPDSFKVTRRVSVKNQTTFAVHSTDVGNRKKTIISSIGVAVHYDKVLVGPTGRSDGDTKDVCTDSTIATVDPAAEEMVGTADSTRPSTAPIQRI